MMPIPVFPVDGKSMPVIILVVLGVLAVAILVDRQASPNQPEQPKQN